jgi:hypothetical protein
VLRSRLLIPLSRSSGNTFKVPRWHGLRPSSVFALAAKQVGDFLDCHLARRRSARARLLRNNEQKVKSLLGPRYFRHTVARAKTPRPVHGRGRVAGRRGTASRRLRQAQLILLPRDQQGVHSTKSIPKAEQRPKCFMLTASAPRLLARALRAGTGGSAAARRMCRVVRSLSA